MNLLNARNLFCGLKNKTFLDAACLSLIPQTSKEEIENFLQLCLDGPCDNASSLHIYMDEKKTACIKNAATLLNVPEKNTTLIESTTHGLNIACNTINFSKDDEVILCDTEYLQVAIPLVKKHQKGLLKIVPIKSNNEGLIFCEDFYKAITPKTKAIFISAVQWCTGQRIFNKNLAKLCKEQGIWLVVDGVQELGALNVDLNELYCDFYISGGHKWLNAPYGCGIMYLSDKALELSPPYYGYLNLEEPTGGWGEYFQDPSKTPFQEFPFPKNAKSFSIGGTGNYPGAIGLNESLKILLKIGSKNAHKQVTSLSKFLRLELSKIGVQVKNLPDSDLSGITIFNVSKDPKKDRNLLEILLKNNIFLSIRYTSGHGGIRASTHYFNNEEDILNLVNGIKNSGIVPIRDCFENQTVSKETP